MPTSSPQCPPPAIPRAETTCPPPRKMPQLREAEGCPPALLLARGGSPANLHREGDTWKLLFTFCVSALSQRAKAPRSCSQRSSSQVLQGQTLRFHKFPSAPEGETCFLQIYTHEALFSSVKIFAGSGGDDRFPSHL